MPAPPGKTESERLAKYNPETSNNTLDCKPRGRAVLPGSLTLLLYAWVPFPSKTSCFFSTCVSSDNSFPSVRRDPLSSLGRGPPSWSRWTSNWRMAARLALPTRSGETESPARGVWRWGSSVLGRKGPVELGCRCGQGQPWGLSVPGEMPLCHCCSDRDALTAGLALPRLSGVGTVPPLLESLLVSS